MRQIRRNKERLLARYERAIGWFEQDDFHLEMIHPEAFRLFKEQRDLLRAELAQ